MMQKPRLVITKTALMELQSRILAQYHHSNKHYKYNHIMNNYQALVNNTPVDSLLKPTYVLAE